MQWLGLMFWQHLEIASEGAQIERAPVSIVLATNELAWQLRPNLFVKVRHEGATVYQTIVRDGKETAYLSGKAEHDACIVQLQRLLFAINFKEYVPFTGLKKFLKTHGTT